MSEKLQQRINEPVTPWLFTSSNSAYFLLIYFLTAGHAAGKANALEASA
ncbi:MAG: hypothetical protein JNJ93_05300 [Acinetobacter sp.]|nr:hypothetical protein [Acinetobacter sp.]